MKRIICTLLLAAGICSAASAQRFRMGLRAGANLTDYTLPVMTFDDGKLYNGGTKAGFEMALLARLNITKHLHLQTEFGYLRAGYAFTYHYNGGSHREVKIHANRLEIPVEAGVMIASTVRLFAGASFRVAHNEKSSVPSLLKIKFDDSDIGVMGGAGLNLGKFFLEGRITGYPGSSRSRITSLGETRRVVPKHNVRWSLSAGVLF